MNKFPKKNRPLRRSLLLGGLAALSWLSAVQAQAPAQPPLSMASAVHRHVQGIAMAHRGDEHGAFNAFLQAAESGYPPAQRKVAEIYDSGNAAVTRDYEESIRWYEKARAGGEQLPSPRRDYPAPPMAPSSIRH